MKNKSFNKNDYKIAVIGLGYIGATLAFEFSKKLIQLVLTYHYPE